MFKKKLTVTASISTRGRHFDTLPMCIASICTQTVKPDKLVIYDDTPPEKRPDLQKHWMWNYIFGTLQLENIQWRVVYGKSQGQVLNHQNILETADTDCVWRIDDDNIAASNCLETLLGVLQDDPKVGACGQNVFFTDRPQRPAPSFAKNKMTNGIEHQVCEWYVLPDGKDRYEIEHLYSTFLYRVKAGREAGGYPMYLSPVGHHEETIFSHRIFRAGYKLVVTPRTYLYHFRHVSGGIRDYSEGFLWEHDQRKQDEQMSAWGYTLKAEARFLIRGGIGDHYAFKSVKDEIFDHYEGCNLVIIAITPEVFHDEKRATVVHFAEAAHIIRDHEMYDVYKYMATVPKMHLTELYKDLYINKIFPTVKKEMEANEHYNQSLLGKLERI